MPIPRGVDLGLVDQLRIDKPSIRDLHAAAGPQTIGRDRRQLRGDERTERVNQVVMIVEVAAIDTVAFTEPIVQPHVVFAVIERVGLLEGGIVCRRRV